MNKDKIKSQGGHSKKYQEHSDALLETQRAINTVPIKNYSDYEITIESKEHYDDALFTDEDELIQSLTHAGNTKKSSEQGSNKQPVNKDPHDSKPCKQYDFSIFGGKKPTVKQAKHNAPYKLAIINNGVNGSSARKQIPFNKNTHAFAQQLEAQVQFIEQEKSQQSLAGANAAEDKPVAPDSSSDTTGIFSSLANKIKNKGQELSLKGKAQLNKSKAELDEYLGRTLPERELDLEFILPMAKKDHSIDFTEQDINTLFSVKGKKLYSILQRAEKELGTLSKCTLSNNKRLSLLNCYAKPLGSKAQSLINMFVRKPVAFDDEKRTIMIELALNACKHLTMGYKQIYISLYQSTNVAYGTQRKTANQVAFQLLDCLLLEQKLSVALHTPTPTASLKTANKLFAAISLYEPEQLNLQQSSISSDQKLSFDQLYCQFQLLATLNLQGLSTSLHRALQQYFEQHGDLLTVLPLAITRRLTTIEAGQQLWQINYQDNNPTLVTHFDKLLTTAQVENSIFIQVQAFFNQVKKDYVEVLRQRIAHGKQHSSIALQTLTHEQCLHLLSTLNQSIRDNENNRPINSFSLYKPADIKAYSGFSSCVSFSGYDYALKSKGLDANHPGHDIPEKPPACKGQWQLAHEDTNALFLQIKEHKLGLALDINSLLLLVISPDDNESSDTNDQEERMVLSTIIAMERHPQGKLLLVARKISEQLSHVDIQPNESDTEAKAAIICCNAEYKLLIVPNEISLNSQQELTLSFPDGATGSITIEGLREQYLESQGLQLL